ncbi:MAG: DUF3810 domain-containing protein [Bacteroidaceae bacterium]|nr:DUF3810 domain-containing protein [Bacteroidaceae bacterium]
MSYIINKVYSTRRLVLLLLILAVLLIRFVPTLGEGYARWCYPYISMALSFVASVVPFSLEEWIVCIVVLLLFAFPIIARKRFLPWKVIVLNEMEIVCWIYVWFYIGWGCNYFRDDFYKRMNVAAAKADEREFKRFLDVYTDSLCISYTSYLESSPLYLESSPLDKESIIEKIKEIYASSIPSEARLCRPQAYQMPKAVVLNTVYSGVGVLGYMGPFMGESQLNELLFPEQYPFVYAHELSHLLGVSNEAEANFWAYFVCTKSDDARIRFAGYYGLLPYVIRNAKAILPEKEMALWLKQVEPDIMAMAHTHSAFWSEQRINLLDTIQEAFYNWYLKGNKIPSGTKNYDQVVQMVMSYFMSLPK